MATSSILHSENSLHHIAQGKEVFLDHNRTPIISFVARETLLDSTNVDDIRPPCLLKRNKREG